MTTATAKAWNPRYLAYCRSQGVPDPDEMISLDAERLGASMLGFSLWIQEKWREFDRIKGHGRDHMRTDSDHRDFDAWLQENYQ